MSEDIYSRAIMKHVSLLPTLTVALLLAATPGPLLRSAYADEGQPTLKSLLDGDGSLRIADRPLDRGALADIYESRDYQPIWTPEREASLLKALSDAVAHGLDPGDFTVPPGKPEERDLLLTDAFLRYAQALAQGRVDSAKIENDWSVPVPEFDGTAILAAAASGDDPAEILAALPPTHGPYRRLQAALQRYRVIAAAGGWPNVPETPRQPKLKRGDHGPAVAALRRRLAVEGFIADSGSDSFDMPLEAAVKRYQTQNGLEPDGHVGPESFAALNVTAAARVEQIRDNLERWREMPRDFPATRIEVNVPAAWLTVFDDGVRGIGMRAIVGAPIHPTPVLTAEMNAVLFNPPWNIPISIMKKEILPHVAADPDYMEKNHYVFVSQHGYSTIRQLPGPGNALGRIKFELPNIYDVYLHDTPSHSLFNKVLRNLSHGCVRLEDPRGLALHVLGGGKKVWNLADIDNAVATGETHRVALPHDIPVYLIYLTAFVDPDGTMEFRNDVYGRDARLDEAMTARDAAEHLGAPAPGPAPTPPAAASPAPAAPKPARGTVPASAPALAPAPTVQKTAADRL
ncbi:MAG TPA: L,D-transpeptidase family protein [Stellaceae bacterium]|nr:L,D-transpeptidase family protein [Stellaceae bacterium]